MRKSKQVQWSRVIGDLVVLKEEKVFVTSGKKKAVFEGHESNDRAKPTPKAAPPSEPPTPRGRSASRKRNIRGKSQSGKFNRQPCKHFLKGTCTKLPCEYWEPLAGQFYKTKSGCKFGAECPFPYWKVEEQPNKKPKKDESKSAVASVKSVRQLSCVSQDTEPPDSATISRKGKRVLEPTRQVRFTRAALRQANIREKKGPSFGKIQVKIPHQRSPNALKFEDRSPMETVRQERCARGDAWELAKSYILFAFWGVGCTGRIHNKTRWKRVCGGLWSKHAHGQHKKNLNEAELETVRVMLL